MVEGVGRWWRVREVAGVRVSERRRRRRRSRGAIYFTSLLSARDLALGKDFF
jgi:hypothetical protein